MLIKKIVSIFTSLKLTVTLLAFSIVLVFIGTIAQADEGLYGAQAHYFKQWVVVGANFFGHKIPLLWPGGYLIGVLLVVNLVCAHIYRFKFTLDKLGIQLAHAGVILLLVGQLATDMLSREMQLHFAEGETRDSSESATDYELNFFTGNTVTAIPAKLLKPGKDLLPAQTGLPFTLHVKEFWKNSDISFRAPMMKNAPAIASNGVALSFDFRPLPDVKTTDEKNIPTAVFEIITDSGSLGTWAASDWSGEASLVGAVQNGYANQLGTNMAHQIASQLAMPQSIELDGKQFTFVLRPLRVLHNFSLKLLKATHTTYPGTDIPKDFRSRVELRNPTTGEDREVEISMNHPLRYGGLTFYQYQMSAGDMVVRAGQTPSSVLSVVRNPGWLTPYVGCAMVAVGLMIQFLVHLTGFISKQKKK